MRHKKKRLQLNRFTSWQDATIKSLARSLLIYETMRTTLHRAKAVRPLAEKLISLAKANTLSAKREAFGILGDHKLVALLFNEIGPRFAKRASGYTRVINLARRRGDDAQVVIFELTEQKPKVKKAKKAKGAKGEKIEKAAGELPEPETQEKQAEKPREAAAVKERAPQSKKPSKKFLGGIRGIFKKERDSL
ncbi:MAG: 50S ribosomal protein L17 [Candidatus Omnitrophica bacterium]|nr:50S ribosomal protein L17 [Candidatus Omnitrophota bacterium]MDD5027558.1 50S ribosomal protein L17 [Candidatus Omnitrophota bacterium]MDD5661692.1 50S ribosomal protein L17 [Candidatus Omnitrophota bacterium]